MNKISPTLKPHSLSMDKHTFQFVTRWHFKEENHAFLLWKCIPLNENTPPNLKYEFMGALFYANPPPLFSSYAEQSIGKLKGAEAINQVTLPWRVWRHRVVGDVAEVRQGSERHVVSDAI